MRAESIGPLIFPIPGNFLGEISLIGRFPWFASSEIAGLWGRGAGGSGARTGSFTKFPPSVSPRLEFLPPRPVDRFYFASIHGILSRNLHAPRFAFFPPRSSRVSFDCSIAGTFRDNRRQGTLLARLLAGESRFSRSIGLGQSESSRAKVTSPIIAPRDMVISNEQDFN